MATTDSKYNMTSAEAHDYIVNPLVAPDPSDETGLNASFRSTFAREPPSVNSSVSQVSGASRDSVSLPNKRHSHGPHSPAVANGARSRGNSLGQRYPGDMSHRPLDMLMKDAKSANRSHHLRKRSTPGVDSIDLLDATPGGQYHHEGPFDATLASRNADSMYSPVAAVAESNCKALKATPVENIKDAVENHRPLDGVATVPPGMPDRYGRTYDYEETNLMTEAGGDYKKFPGEVLNDDQKKALGQRQTHETADQGYGEASGIELQHHHPNKSVDVHENEI